MHSSVGMERELASSVNYMYIVVAPRCLLTVTPVTSINFASYVLHEKAIIPSSAEWICRLHKWCLKMHTAVNGIIAFPYYTYERQNLSWQEFPVRTQNVLKGGSALHSNKGGVIESAKIGGVDAALNVIDMPAEALGQCVRDTVK